jgi:putative transposase
MSSVVMSLLLTLRPSVRSRAMLHLEILALRHQLHLLERSRPRRVRLTPADRLLWVWLSRVWRDWRAVVIVKSDTILAWHRHGFRLVWAWKSRRRGRPTVAAKVRTLIRTVSEANPLWGAPRLHGELLKLGIDVSQATVAKYHVIVMTEAGLRRILAEYFAYYHHARTHLALNKDGPVSRPVTA